MTKATGGKEFVDPQFQAAVHLSGHLTSTVKRSEQSTSLYMLSLACPFHSVEEEPAHKMGLPTSVNLGKKIPHRHAYGPT